MKAMHRIGDWTKWQVYNWSTGLARERNLGTRWKFKVDVTYIASVILRHIIDLRSKLRLGDVRMKQLIYTPEIAKKAYRRQSRKIQINEAMNLNKAKKKKIATQLPVFRRSFEYSIIVHDNVCMTGLNL